MNQKIKGMCFTIIIGGSCWGMSGVMGKYLFNIKNMTATVLQYSAPVFIMFFCIFVEKRIPKVIEMIVLIAVICGVFLLATHGNVHNLAITDQALFWGLFSAVAFAIYSIQPGKLMIEYGTMEITGWGMLLGGIMVAPFTKVWEVPGHWDEMTILMTTGVVVVGTIVAFCCYLRGISMLGPVQGSMLGCVEPLVSTILSVMVLGDVFGAMDIMGIVCIVEGVTALTVLDR